MYYEDDSGVNKFVTGMLVGAVLGAGIALLTAPQSGRSTRTRLVRVVRRSRDAGEGDADSQEMDRDEIMAELKTRRRKRAGGRRVR
jgi:gas vesicle protein